VREILSGSATPDDRSSSRSCCTFRDAILRLIRPAAARSAAARRLVEDFARYLDSFEGSAAQ
jgi:hypothetical protein